jgi:signal transduction histidine kinase
MEDSITTGFSRPRKTLTSSHVPWWGIGTTLPVIIPILLAGYFSPRAGSNSVTPAIRFTSIPVAGADNPEKLSTIKGRVLGSQPGQQIVLYARGQTQWWVQPFADQPFTKIQSNSKWSSSTHPGTEYAALLVGPDFQPPPTTEVLPTEGVLASVVARGGVAFWQKWWFPVACLVTGAFATFGFHRLRLHQLTRRLEERLLERTQVAQELHDTLLQGVVSASMQLHMAVDQLPADSPAQPAFNRVLKLMGQVVEEGHHVVRGLRSSVENPADLERAFLRIQQEMAFKEQVNFHVLVKGRPRPVRATVRDDLYSVGREALVNAFRHSRATNIAVELVYAGRQMRIRVRDNGCGIDPKILRTGREGHRGLSGMYERAEKMGARLRGRSRVAAGTEVELSVPRHIAFQLPPSNGWPGWLARWFPRREDCPS